MRKWICPKSPEETRDLIIIPESMVETIMSLHHSSIFSTHPGVANCVNNCLRTTYWPGMKKDIKMYIEACENCGQNKHPQAYLKSGLKHIIFHKFNDAIVIDHIVPSSQLTTPRGFRYILTITDHWSGLLVAIPVKSQTAEENIKSIFRSWVLVHGMPRELICDNHPGFSAKFFEAVLKAFQCKVTHGTSYKARSTGKAEASNKRLNGALRSSLPLGKENHWDVYLPYATFALNSLRNRHTGYSPNRCAYGRELNTPLNVMLEDDTDVTSQTYGYRVYEMHKP